MRHEIAGLFRNYRNGQGADVRLAAEAFDHEAPGGLSSNQRYHYQAMESLLRGHADYWPESSPSTRGAAPIRRCIRLMVDAARRSDSPAIIFNAGRVLAQAAHQKHPAYSELSKWDWQYLGTDEGKPGTKFGFTSRSQPFDRVKAQRGLRLELLLPVHSKAEMDTAVKRTLDLVYGPCPADQPETYFVSLEGAVKIYLEHRS